MCFLRVVSVAIVTALAILAVADTIFVRTFPHFARLADNFSAPYLSRTVAGVDRRTTVFAGDSALWGYGLPAQDAAVSLLRDRGAAVENLSYEGGSPANTYAVLRVLFASGARPKAVVFDVNQKEFNPADGAYQTLYPGVERLAWPLLTEKERALLTPTAREPITDASIDERLGSVWKLYGMRADLRYALFGNVDAAHALKAWLEGATGATARAAAAHRPVADRFEGTYDLSPIDANNVSMAYVRDTLTLLRAVRVKAYAILTPTNHALLHEYIDVPEYGRNLETVRQGLTAGGVTVLDYDRRFATGDFIDNDHLTAAGNRKLANLIAHDVSP